MCCSLIFNELRKFSTCKQLIFRVFELCNRERYFFVKKVHNTLIFAVLWTVENNCNLDFVKIMNFIFLSSFEQSD